jgi:hypothetical protein
MQRDYHAQIAVITAALDYWRLGAFEQFSLQTCVQTNLRAILPPVKSNDNVAERRMFPIVRKATSAAEDVALLPGNEI